MRGASWIEFVHGSHTGNLFSDSNLGRVAVPVTVNASHVPPKKVYLPVITR